MFCDKSGVAYERRLAGLVQPGGGLVVLSARRERGQYRVAAVAETPLARATARPSTWPIPRRNHCSLVCRLCIWLRLPFRAAARRRAENMSLRHLAFERIHRPVGRNCCGDMLRSAMGYSLASTGEIGAVGYCAKHL